MKERKPITAEKYNKKMNKIIEKYQPQGVAECLIALLEESSKWKIIGLKEKKGAK